MENFLSSYNVITPIIIVVFAFPFLMSLFRKVTKTSIWISMAALLRTVEFLVSVSLSVYLTKTLFFDNQISAFENIKSLITTNLGNQSDSDAIIYMCVVPILFILISIIFKLIIMLVENNLFDKLSSVLYTLFDSLWEPLRLLVKLLFQIPSAVFNVLIVVIMITVFSMYMPSAVLSEQLESSKVYSIVQQYTIKPLLDSKYVQKIPVIFNQTFGNVNRFEIPEELLKKGALPDKEENTRIIWYFNGVTLEDAVKSNQDIDNFAKDLVKTETDSRKKAKIIYIWVASHVKYDYLKAEKITKGITDENSGAIEAFSARKGICFDQSALYVAMCRAVGLKVRLITGVAYNGMVWGEHSWNQVYIPEENKWVNVDTTFAIGGIYFDRKNFTDDHKMARTVGEW